MDWSRDENTSTKIENYFETSKPDEVFTESSFFKSHYSPATLINDWCVQRARNEPQIISSEPFVTEHMDQYRKLCKMPLPERQSASDSVSKSYGLDKEILIDHLGKTFYNNYATTYDLFFNHLTKGKSGPFVRKYHKGRYIPELDLTAVYGNLTQWGIKESLFLGKEIICDEKPPISESSAEYVPYDVSAVKKLNDFSSFRKVKKVI